MHLSLLEVISLHNPWENPRDVQRDEESKEDGLPWV